jgi:very-short-patch-repair endonuclease
MTPEDHVIAARESARSVAGVVCRGSAALCWGWSIKFVPPRPQLTLSLDRRLAKERLEGVQIRWLDLPDCDVVDGVTSEDRTLLDCLRHYPVEIGLGVADSALRHGISGSRLERLAAGAKGPGSVKIRFVARHADARSANAFESSLRAIAKSVDGLNAVPQVEIWDPEFLGRPDLVDEELRIVIEADSFQWHGGRDGLAQDARRYNKFVVNGWLVLRFSWEDVMFHPESVREVIVQAVVSQRSKRDRDDW